MPISKYDRYFGGNAAKALAAMKKQYGEGAEDFLRDHRQAPTSLRSGAPSGRTIRSTPEGC
jgi:hypothetical protein